MMIAENLRRTNNYYRALCDRWKDRKLAASEKNVRIATRFCRSAFAIVAGRQVYDHPSTHSRDYILRKLQRFHADHDAPLEQVLDDLRAACGHVPEEERTDEAVNLAEELRRTRKRGPESVATILPAVLAGLIPQEVLKKLGTDKELDPS